MIVQTAIREVTARRDLDQERAFEVATEIMTGGATPCQIAGLLVALHMKGETVDEITGFVRAMRAKAVPVPIEADGLVDTCGTGGDGAGTFNISTVSALVAAGAGCKIAKHGNRSVSSRCGSAEVLEALGVDIELPPEKTANIIEKIGVGFLFAPQYHKAACHAVVPRREIAVRSIFNIVGPLTNPAGAKRQVIGVFDPGLTERLAHVLEQLGSVHCLVVHGADGLDEITLDGPTTITELKVESRKQKAENRKSKVESPLLRPPSSDLRPPTGGGGVHTRTITPGDLGLPRVPRERLAGGDAADNARIALSVLGGDPGPARDIVLANAAAAIYVAGRAHSLRQGVVEAARAIDSGAALEKLEALRCATREA